MMKESQGEPFGEMGFLIQNTPIFLAQSETTAGFLCSDFTRLNTIKGRPKAKDVLLTLDSCSKLKKLVRPPTKYKNQIRKRIKTTFIYRGKHALKQHSCDNTNLAIRVVKGFQETSQCASHADFLQFFPFLYSSSANAHKQKFDLDFALKIAEIVVLDKRGLKESNPSKIYKISNSNLKCIR